MIDSAPTFAPTALHEIGPSMSDDGGAPVRLIAFYLPQFHPIPENDAWWGRGFTEWTNVAKARPLFRGHYQPHLPADLGFCDLRVPETREAQADLARAHGIHGFCYYHYWFGGRRILERPFEETLASGRPDFPFCLCWANENWTRRWDGAESAVLLEQSYGEQDDLCHIRALLPALADPRYIRVGGRPLLLVYRTELLPNPARTADIWRVEAARAGVGDLYLARVEAFDSGADPASIGFDAAVEFAPEWRRLGRALTPEHRRWRYGALSRLRLISRAYRTHIVQDYAAVVRAMLDKPAAPYVRFAGVAPSWDNSPRKAEDALILRGATPERYGAWLAEAVRRTEERLRGEERLVFVNAWNEWGEGCHLEPDQRFGRGYLEATRAVIPGGAVGQADCAQRG